MSDNELREKLAAYAHVAWAGWMKYLFEKCGPHYARGDNGEYIETEARTIPVWAVERWTRQMNTPYADLPESEKESDREEAEKMLEIVRAATAPALSDEDAQLLELVRLAREASVYAMNIAIGDLSGFAHEDPIAIRWNKGGIWFYASVDDALTELRSRLAPEPPQRPTAEELINGIAQAIQDIAEGQVNEAEENLQVMVERWDAAEKATQHDE